MGYDEQAVLLRVAESNKAFFVFGMVRVGCGERQRVTENRGSFGKRDAVFLLVALRLVVVPFELSTV